MFSELANLTHSSAPNILAVRVADHMRKTLMKHVDRRMQETNVGLSVLVIQLRSSISPGLGVNDCVHVFQKRG